jgi:hypothetical protein
MLNRLLLIGILLLHAVPAQALNCEIRSTHLDKFGLAPLGSSWKAIEGKAQAARNCDIDRAKNYADCEFVDTVGVRYAAFGPWIVRKEIDARSLAAATTPFRLTAKASLLDAIKELTGQSNSANFYVTFRHGKVFLTTDHCLRNSHGTVFAFYVVFSARGDLETIGTRIQTEAD